MAQWQFGGLETEEDALIDVLIHRQKVSSSAVFLKCVPSIGKVELKTT